MKLLAGQDVQGKRQRLGRAELRQAVSNRLPKFPNQPILAAVPITDLKTPMTVGRPLEGTNSVQDLGAF